LVAEVQAVGDGLAAKHITIDEHRTRIAQLEAQGLATERLREAQKLEAVLAANDLLDELTEGWPPVLVDQQWTGWWAACVECEWQAGPCDTQAEATTHADRHDAASRRRARFTADEWELYADGLCSWRTASGLAWSEYCGQPSLPGQPFGYCREHDWELGERGGEAAGEAP
jgi:hypothetical protein